MKGAGVLGVRDLPAAEFYPGVRENRGPSGGRALFNRPIRFVDRISCGTVIAPVDGMSRLLSATASMNCPLCGWRVAPTAESSWVLAWYDCPSCGLVWSARIRNGQPDMPLTGDACLGSLPYKERP
jgi:predicted RNA-binding Zn-ribbon protein involved in translation (DUF1610 family)